MHVYVLAYTVYFCECIELQAANGSECVCVCVCACAACISRDDDADAQILCGRLMFHVRDAYRGCGAAETRRSVQRHGDVSIRRHRNNTFIMYFFLLLSYSVSPYLPHSLFVSGRYDNAVVQQRNAVNP